MQWSVHRRSRWSSVTSVRSVPCQHDGRGHGQLVQSADQLVVDGIGRTGSHVRIGLHVDSCLSDPAQCDRFLHESHGGRYYHQGQDGKCPIHHVHLSSSADDSSRGSLPAALSRIIPLFSMFTTKWNIAPQLWWARPLQTKRFCSLSFIVESCSNDWYVECPWKSVKERSVVVLSTKKGSYFLSRLSFEIKLERK